MSETDSRRLAEAFLLRCRYGVLSTHSAALPGYPFGSVTPYVVTDGGELAILISTIAQHTANILSDRRVSLTVFDPADAADPQAGPRLTWIADAIAPTTEHSGRVAARYLRHFPAAASYDLTHDFRYYCLKPVRVRLIGGFGSIHWIEPEQLDLANPLGPDEAGILDHMNTDHAGALGLIAQCHAGCSGDAVLMTGIDSRGMDLLIDGAARRVPFAEPITTPQAARQVLVQLTREARQRAAA